MSCPVYCSFRKKGTIPCVPHHPPPSPFLFIFINQDFIKQQQNKTTSFLPDNTIKTGRTTTNVLPPWIGTSLKINNRN